MATMYGMLVAPDQSDRPSMPGDSASPPPMSMAPPPSAEFTTREALLEFQKEWAENQGFAVVIGRSRPNRLWLKCDRGGEYSDKHLHDPENRKRKRKATRLTGCPFNVKATMKKDKIWRCHTEVGEHNHPPSEDLSVHPSLRRMTDEQLQKVNEMTEAGKTPVETLDELQRLWPGIKVLRRDIYNARKKYKTEKELADFAQGLVTPQQYEDPNGKMPGPTRTGRWEWLEEGDEVRRKKRKKSSISGTTSTATSIGQSNLAPELRDQPIATIPSPATRRQAPGLGTLPPRPFQAAVPSSAQQQALPPSMRQPEADSYSGGVASNAAPGSSPRTFRHYNPPNPNLNSGARSGYRTPSTQSILQPDPLQQHNAAVRARATPNPQQQQQLQQHQHQHQHQHHQHHQQQQQQQQQQAQQPQTQQTSLGAPSHQQGPQQVQVQQQEPVPLAPMLINGGGGLGGMMLGGGGPAGGGPGQGGGGATGNKSASGQVLMSRIERMEKEQRDQKAMLTQILGAVQGINGLRR